jgi:hypothetical protein
MGNRSFFFCLQADDVYSLSQKLKYEVFQYTVAKIFLKNFLNFFDNLPDGAICIM